MSQNNGDTEGRGCRVVRIANTLPKYRRYIVLLAFFGKANINGKPELIEIVIEKLKRLAPLVRKHGFHTVIANAAQRSQPSPHHGKCRIASRKDLLRHREFRNVRTQSVQLTRDNHLSPAAIHSSFNHNPSETS
jgi:hypothetical protein